MTIKLGRNERCFCGSGKKFKNCCMNLHNEKVNTSGLELVIKFLMRLFIKTKNDHIIYHIAELEDLLQLIKDSEDPFYVKKNLDPSHVNKKFSPIHEKRDLKSIPINDILHKTFAPVISLTIDSHPQLKNQLLQFWEAHMKVTQVSNTNKKSFAPLKVVQIMTDRIITIQKMYDEIEYEARSSKPRSMYLYSLFYLHILNTESLGYALLNQFTELLNEYKFNDIYDPIAIFSVNEKIPRGENFVTDVKAVRDAAAHFKYEILDENGLVKIHFKNYDKGYKFDKIFSEEEFLIFLKNSEILYEVQLNFLWLLITLPIIKKIPR